MLLRDKILLLSKQLFPTGRVWWIRRNGVFWRIMRALSTSEARVIQAAKDIYNSCLVDNDSFNEFDARNWERIYGITRINVLTLEERKLKILDRMKFPGDISARQHYLYIQYRLQSNGFNVFLTENIPAVSVQSSKYGEILYGTTQYGLQATYTGELVVNNIDYTKDEDFSIGGIDNMKAVFFIGAETFPNSADVLSSRRNEFRELILKLKPAYSVAVLFINYI